MAGVNSATLITKISEKITLNGNKYDNIIEKRINGITDILKRIVTVPAANDTTVLGFKSTVGHADTEGVLDIENVKYIRVTNLDDTNSVRLALKIDAGEDDTGADEGAELTLNAGMSFILSTPHDAIYVDSSSASLGTDLDDLESITIDSGDDNDVDIEVLVASS